MSLDWTDFDADGHATLVLNSVTDHGRATPLLWKTVRSADLKNRRNDYEDELLQRLHDALPRTVRVTILADRGFGDQKLYAVLRHLGFDFVIRFRGCIYVTSAAGERRKAQEWLHPNGRLRELRGVGVTAEEAPVERVVMVHARGMKDAWFLASSRTDGTGAAIKRLYGRRFTIENCHARCTSSTGFLSRPRMRDRSVIRAADPLSSRSTSSSVSPPRVPRRLARLASIPPDRRDALYARRGRVPGRAARRARRAFTSFASARTSHSPSFFEERILRALTQPRSIHV